MRGEKKGETPASDIQKNIDVNEPSYGAFYRLLELPGSLDAPTVQATIAKGVLKIVVPKPTCP